LENEIKERNLAPPNFAPQILDIFSGSGCIGISILKNKKNIFVDFAEINPNFIQQIKKNLKINQIENKNWKIFQSDIFKNLPTKK
jgi:methylase of polypeptide subunit release factors